MKNFFHRYWLWMAAAALLLTGAIIWLVFPPYGNLASEVSEGSFTTEELFREFTGDPTGTSLRLSGKVIILEGKVAATDKGYIILGQEMVLIRCIFRKTIYDRKPNLAVGDSVTLKCVCRGLNLMEVLVTDCISINKVSR